ncbi:hypothetical protein [Streptomyces sp. NPDC001889]
MRQLLEWDGFRLREDEERGTLMLRTEWSRMEVLARTCESIGLLAHGAGPRLILHFTDRARQGEERVVVRVAVPEDRVHDAREAVELLRRAHGIPEAAESEQEEEPLVRIPRDSPEWVVSPASGISDALYAEVFGRIESERVS